MKHLELLAFGYLAAYVYGLGDLGISAKPRKVVPKTKKLNRKRNKQAKRSRRKNG